MEKKNFFVRHWQLAVYLLSTAFMVGYTVNELDGKTDKEEVRIIVEDLIKEKYVPIEKVPGLTESLKAIKDKLDELSKKVDKIEDKLIYK